MSYTTNTWVTGDTITATKLNNMESGISEANDYDLVISTTEIDSAANLTTSNCTIESGGYSACLAKAEAGDAPKIRVHGSATLDGVTIYAEYKVLNAVVEKNYYDQIMIIVFGGNAVANLSNMSACGCTMYIDASGIHF